MYIATKAFFYSLKQWSFTLVLGEPSMTHTTCTQTFQCQYFNENMHCEGFTHPEYRQRTGTSLT